ncbi:30S ribosomal protein S17 [candidate division WWE3 bacterium CG08_land_8_20_14_0_20_43_13]|uniref:30S ribosomal protein S17 n=1 Tax=candidate division WWE3 bacterium CG08_land_8_20_14_0_20_43_13 TaxID=1975087 RepID=A0A2H0X773_UNCKA|nr:MAG: 30S ribosomal protein S17 [candidate division WWE3 bacterium CG08_land_8_20_14_0_20_43_13]
MTLRRLTGVVISNKMTNTAVVSVNSFRHHPLYEKRYRVTQKFMTDNLLGAQEGNQVVIEECRPLSKKKCWKIIEVVKNN